MNKGIIAIACLVMLFTSTASSEITIELSTGEVRYYAEDVFMLKLDLVIDEDAGFFGDVWLAMMDPGGKVYFAPAWDDLSAPAVRNIYFPSSLILGSADLLSIEIPDDNFPIKDKGEYIFAIAISEPGTADFIDITTCTTSYVGEREWLVIDEDDGIEDTILGIIEDRHNGGYWFGSFSWDSSKPPLYHYKDGVLKNYGKDQDFDAFLTTDMLYDSDNNLWISSIGLNKYNPDEDLFVNYIPPDYHPEDDPYHLESSINSIVYDNKGTIWAGTAAGICRFDLEDESWANYDEKAGLVCNEIMEITLDNEGNVWTVGYYGDARFVDSGVSKFDGTNFTNFLPGDFNIDYDKLLCNSIGIDNVGSIWIASDMFGLEPWNAMPHRYVDGEWLMYTTEDGLTSNNIYTFYLDRFGNFWSANKEQPCLAQFEDDRWFTVLPEIHELGMDGISVIYQDSNNNFWFGGWPAIAIRWGSD
jgi:hypothetical protein